MIHARLARTVTALLVAAASSVSFAQVAAPRAQTPLPSKVAGPTALAPKEQPLDPVIREKLGIEAYSVQRLEPVIDAAGMTRISVSLGDEPVVLVLGAHSLRGDDFKLVTIGADGVETEVEAPSPATYRGRIEGEEGTKVRATIVNGAAQVVIVREGHVMWGIQPVCEALPGADPAEHVVYAAADMRVHDGICGLTGLEEDHSDGPQEGDEPSGLRGTGLKICDVACDADFLFYQLNGSSILNTLVDIENVLNNVEAIYEDDVAITFEVTTIVVRTSDAEDPYSTTNPGALLGQFDSHWGTNHGAIRRDVAHLFTGRNLDGGVIGIASLGVICNIGQAFGLSQSRFSTNSVTRACLTAHEMGHNWNAQHCNGDPACAIMCSTLNGCAGGCSQFSQGEQNQIESHRNSRTCLSDLADPVSPPFVEPFPTAALSTSNWSYNDGGAISLNGVNEPSAAHSMLLNASSAAADTDDDLRTNFIRLGGSGAPMELRYFVQHRGVEAAEELIVDVWVNNTRWTEINRVVSDGIDQDNYVEFVHPLTSTMLHDEFRVRFRTNVNEFNDNWYIDDVYVGETIETPLPLPFVEEFPTTTADVTRWSWFQGVINTLGIGEPSAPNSVELDSTSLGGDEIKTHALDLSGATPATLSYWTQHIGVEAGETLRVEIFNQDGAWQEVNLITSNGVNSSFEQSMHELTGAALHDQFRVRFRPQVNQGDDNWYLDDIRVERPEEPDCAADFDNSGTVTSADITSFLTAWFADLVGGTTVADFNNSGATTSADITSFLTAWFAALTGPCP
ncbi:MAG: hypothetical protein H7Y88_08070 [Phycisphaerales bacterium]|nr:hypothetical protein [Phycisphaerales bacterium]